MLKISPDLSDEAIDRVTDILIETPLDGIVATNGTYRHEGLQTDRTALDRLGSGRLSGAPLTARAVEIVRRIHPRSGGTYPIIGAGGLMSADGVRAMLDAGADLVQLYTGCVYHGPGLIREVCRALIADTEARAAEATPETGSEKASEPTPEAPQDSSAELR